MAPSLKLDNMIVEVVEGTKGALEVKIWKLRS